HQIADEVVDRARPGAAPDDTARSLRAFVALDVDGEVGSRDETAGAEILSRPFRLLTLPADPIRHLQHDAIGAVRRSRKAGRVATMSLVAFRAWEAIGFPTRQDLDVG